VFQEFYPSKDGTKIPMFLVHARALKKDGSHPVFLYGYGGFENSIQPYYKLVSQRMDLQQNMMNLSPPGIHKYRIHPSAPYSESV
jgi:prolyl oligopeptidase PreP (S9A serine peptidase family)